MKKQSDKATLLWIIKKSKPQHSGLLILSIGNVLFAAIAVFFSLMCRGIVDGAVNGQKDTIIKYAVLLFGCIAMQVMLSLYCNSKREKLHARLEMAMRKSLLCEILKKDFDKISHYHSGELLNRMFSDVKVVCDGVAEIVPSVLNMLTRLLCAVAVLVFLDAKFTIVFFVAGVCVFFISKALRSKMKGLHKAVMEKEGNMRSFAQETLESLLVMKTFGCEEKAEQKNEENQLSHYKARMKRRNISILSNAGFGFIFQLGYFYALVWGAFSIFSDTMTYGTLTAILQLVGQIQMPFANLSSVFPKFYSMVASAERIIEIEKLEDEKPADKTLSYSDFDSIKISDMSFSYGENSVLKNVDIKINKGDFVSVTGISGGGKSTLFLLLLGAYSADSGKIEFLSDSKVFSAGKETRGLFGYVPQGNCLFSGTVKENISFLCENADDDAIKNAARLACADEFIEGLPCGYETKIGENGFGISQGQAQRIAVARAILSGADILLLDEATSALDEETERRLLENISTLSDKTVIIVTHRPKAMSICNKHLSLRNGELFYAD